MKRDVTDVKRTWLRVGEHLGGGPEEPFFICWILNKSKNTIHLTTYKNKKSVCIFWWTAAELPADGLSQFLFPAVGVILQPQPLDEWMSCRNNKGLIYRMTSTRSGWFNETDRCVSAVYYPERLWAQRGVWLVRRRGKVLTLSAELAGSQCSANMKKFQKQVSKIVNT